MNRLLRWWSNVSAKRELESLLEQGNAYMAQEKFQLAITTFEKAVEIEPNYTPSSVWLASAHRSLGDIYLTHEQYDLALVSYERAVESDPDNADIYLASLGDIYVSEGKYDLAIATFERATEIDANHAQIYRNHLAGVHYHLAHVYARQDQKEASLQSLRKTFDLDAGYIECAQADRRFDQIHGSSEFQALIGRFKE